MAKSKKTNQEKKTKSSTNLSTSGSKKTNRYNAFQRELSEYLRESGSSKDFRKYTKLYKKVGKDVPVKAFRNIIHALILKHGEKQKSLKYTESFPFYNAKGEFNLMKYNNVLLKIKFNDGGFELDWEGSNTDFMGWFSGDVMAYFRNNYNDSGNMANFVLKGGDEKFAEYEIEVPTGLPESSRYVPVASDLQSGKTSPPQRGMSTTEQEIMLLKAKERVLDKEMELIRQLKELGFTNEEIKKRLLG